MYIIINMVGGGGYYWVGGARPFMKAGEGVMWFGSIHKGDLEGFVADYSMVCID